MQYGLSLGRNGLILYLHFDGRQNAKQTEKNMFYASRIIKTGNVDRCIFIEPFVSRKLSRKLMGQCKTYRTVVNIVTSKVLPSWAISHVMESCDNEVVIRLNTMDKEKFMSQSESNDSPMDLVKTAAECFHKGIHLTIRINSELPDFITEYDLINVVQTFRNWIHLVSIDQTINHLNIDWNNVIDFILDNKLDLQNDREGYFVD